MALPSSNAVPASELLYDRSARTKIRLGFDRVIGWLLPLLFLVAILPILDLVYYVSERAVPSLTYQVLTSSNPYQIDALAIPIQDTIELMTLATIFAVLLGLFGGVATAELLSERWAGWVRSSANMMVGTPSIITGYFGFFVFCTYFGWGLSFGAGVVTLAVFMSPYIFRTADLAFTSVPRHIREAALGSGASPSQYILKVALPIAFPQILTGVFLAMAIGVGETAPIWLTTTPGLLPPTMWTSPTKWVAALIWENYNGGTGAAAIDLAWQCAFLLIVIVISLNIVVRLVAYRYQKRLEGLYQ
jgi:phosphate transport system permease protein